jgi:hypothetical protein
MHRSQLRQTHWRRRHMEGRHTAVEARCRAACGEQPGAAAHCGTGQNAGAAGRRRSVSVHESLSRHASSRGFEREPAVAARPGLRARPLRAGAPAGAGGRPRSTPTWGTPRASTRPGTPAGRPPPRGTSAAPTSPAAARAPAARARARGRQACAPTGSAHAERPASLCEARRPAPAPERPSLPAPHRSEAFNQGSHGATEQWASGQHSMDSRQSCQHRQRSQPGPGRAAPFTRAD